MILITNFLELRVVAERHRQLAGRHHAVPTLFACRHTAATLSRTCRERHICGMAGERHGMYESNMAELCKSNGKVII
jgi:hypothetical protein